MERRRKESFPRSRRILTQADFQRVLRAGRRVMVEELQLVFLANDLGVTRLGLAVSRKVGDAVTRNLVKRRLREIFRRNPDRFPPDTDLLVIAFPSAARVPFARLRDSLLELASRAKPRRASREAPRRGATP